VKGWNLIIILHNRESSYSDYKFISAEKVAQLLLPQLWNSDFEEGCGESKKKTEFLFKEI